MAVPKKFVVAPSAATRELWRVAENGELDELADLLPRADINARNEHGMTALMRAAYHGHVKMVRALLDHGADPNVTRNDNFTALSLAAFFGHTEIVEMLIGYGARTDVSTRYGTSAHMWAKARSYGDVAQCLQKRRKEEVVLPKPIPPPPPAPIRQPLPQPEFEPEPPLAVRTLSEPPEIWDLVHEAPRNFSAGSAFVSRVGSITAGVVFGIVAFLLVAGGIIGVWYWKQTWPPQTATAAPQPAPITNAASIPTTTAPAEVPVDVPPVSNPEPVAPRPGIRRYIAKPRVTQQAVESTASVPPPPVAPKVELRAADTSAPANKPAPPVTPQLISTPKPQQPKGKVIQWP